jgi:hypothetical protein
MWLFKIFSKYSCLPLIGVIAAVLLVATSNKSVSDNLPCSNADPCPLSNEAYRPLTIDEKAGSLSTLSAT